MNAPRLAPNAAHAFGGIWRLTTRRYFNLGHWLMLLGMLAVLYLFATVQRHLGGGPEHYLAWMSEFYLCFLTPMLAFIAAGGVMRDDLQAESVDYVFTRPIRRPWFVFSRYASHVACAQLDFLLALGLLFAVGAARDVPALWETLPRLLLAQVLVIVAFSAFGFFCGMLTSGYVIIGLVYGAIIEVGVGNVPTQLSRISMITQVLGLLRPIMTGAMEAESPTRLAAAVSVPAAVLTLLAFATAMLLATAALLSVREFAGTGRDN